MPHVCMIHGSHGFLKSQICECERKKSRLRFFETESLKVLEFSARMEVNLLLLHCVHTLTNFPLESTTDIIYSLQIRIGIRSQ